MKAIKMNLTPIRYMEFWHDEGDPTDNPVTALTLNGRYLMNRATSQIWRYLDGSTSIQEIIQNLSSFYPDTGYDRIRQDVIRVLIRLHHDGLIHLYYTSLNPNREHGFYKKTGRIHHAD